MQAEEQIGNDDPGFALRLINSKHKEYHRLCVNYRWLYYSLRLIGGLAAGILPFVVISYPPVATVLSFLIVVSTVVDLVFAPKNKWQLYSRATDLLKMEELKRSGEYRKFKQSLKVLEATETAALETLVNIGDLVKQARESANGTGKTR